MRRTEKRKMALALLIVTCMSAFAGCGKADSAQKEGAVACDGAGELISDEDAKALLYMKKYAVEDVYGDGGSYEVYAPDGSDNSEDFLGYVDHGINFFAAVYGGGGEEFPYMMLNESLKVLKTDWEDSGLYSDMQFGEVMKNGADRYVVVSATTEDYNGTPYNKKVLYYLDIPKTGIGVLWNVEVDEMGSDETTEAILAELGQCYGISLEGFVPSGEWAQADASRKAAAQDVYEPEEGEPELTAVDGYQYLGQVTLSFDDGRIQCPVMAPMGRNTSVYESSLSATMHGVSLFAIDSPLGTSQYVPLMKSNAESHYEMKVNDEYEENRNVHKSDIMEMKGYEDAYYYIIDYETPDYTGDYYKEVKVHCWIAIEEGYLLDCTITLRTNEYDESTNALLKELETAYGIDLSEYYNEENTVE